VLDEMSRRYSGLPLLLCGYSFGAWVGLRVGCGDDRVAALIGIGLPVSLFSFEFLHACTKPLALIQGDQDRFGPLPLLMGMAASLPGGARVLPVRGAAHNFDGRLEELGRRVSEAIPASLTQAAGPGPASGPAS
jgi:alpha/beta superfamily hydrolase